VSSDLLLNIWREPKRRPVLGNAEWETLLGQARQSRLQGRLAQHFLDQGWLEGVALGPRRHLEGALRLVERQRVEVAWESDQLRKALSPLATPVVLLKGAAYLMAGLRPAAGRLFSDIDIMVGKPVLGSVETALFAAGWLGEERDAYTNHYYREWMHEIPPMKHVHRGTVVDLHHTIAPPTSRFAVDGARLMERALSIPGQCGFFMLAPVDMVLHSATHLFQEGDFGHGLRDLLDLNDLVVEFGVAPAFWDDLLERAAELRLEVPLSHGLVQLRRLLGTEAPARLAQRVARLDRRPLRRVAMTTLLDVALRPDHPSCDRPLTAVARWLLYVRSHHLRMPLHRVAPHLLRKAWMRRFPAEAVKVV
jgi:hypothetical protein